MQKTILTPEQQVEFDECIDDLLQRGWIEIEGDMIRRTKKGEDALFAKHLESFVAGVQDLVDDFDRHYPVKIEIRDASRKYIGIDDIEIDHHGTNRSVFCFIASEDGNTKTLGPIKRGDVLKAASYKTPAKHARGNIFDEWNGLRGRHGRRLMEWTGPEYLNGSE